jgi:hypothetical protein
MLLLVSQLLRIFADFRVGCSTFYTRCFGGQFGKKKKKEGRIGKRGFQEEQTVNLEICE